MGVDVVSAIKEMTILSIRRKMMYKAACVTLISFAAIDLSFPIPYAFMLLKHGVL